VLIYDKKPDAKTVNRLNTALVFWCVYGDEHYRTFMFFRKLAKHGMSSEFTIKGHLFRSHGGMSH
jgi:hypothetical protein